MNEDLSKYNWITSDGKTVRPLNDENYNPYDKKWIDAEADTIKLVFACEGLQVNKVYKWEELQPEYEGLYGTVWCKIDEHTYISFLQFKNEMKWQLSDVRPLIRLKDQVNIKNMKYEVSESEYDIVAFRIKYGDLYEPHYQINTGYNVTDRPNWIDANEASYNRHNQPYRRIVYRLKDQPKEEDHIPGISKKVSDHIPDTGKMIKESVGDAAFKIMGDRYVNYEYPATCENAFTDGFEKGAQWQLQNLPIDEILQLVAERAEASNEVRGNLLSPKVNKQSILSCKEEVFKLLNKQK